MGDVQGLYMLPEGNLWGFLSHFPWHGISLLGPRWRCPCPASRITGTMRPGRPSRPARRTRSTAPWRMAGHGWFMSKNGNGRWYKLLIIFAYIHTHIYIYTYSYYLYIYIYIYTQSAMMIEELLNGVFHVVHYQWNKMVWPPSKPCFCRLVDE